MVMKEKKLKTETTRKNLEKKTKKKKLDLIGIELKNSYFFRGFLELGHSVTTVPCCPI